MMRKHHHTNGVIFRGQKCADWNLDSSMSRLLRRRLPPQLREVTHVAKSNELDCGAILYESFRRRASSFQEPTAMSDNLLWARMQHHSGVSPLLDWTTSPFVAAFFALAEVVMAEPIEKKSGYAAVWALSFNRVAEVAKHNNVDFRYLRIEDPHNQRIVAQEGRFTFLEGPGAIDLLECKSSPQRRSFLKCYLLPWSCAEVGLMALKKMNISYSTLFPDLHGQAMYAAMSAAMPDYEGMSLPSKKLISPGQSQAPVRVSSRRT